MTKYKVWGMMKIPILSADIEAATIEEAAKEYYQRWLKGEVAAEDIASEVAVTVVGRDGSFDIISF